MNEQTKSILGFLRTSLLWFLVFYFAMTLLQGRNNDAPVEEAPMTGWDIAPQDDSVRIGAPVMWDIIRGEGAPALAKPCGVVLQKQTDVGDFAPISDLTGCAGVTAAIAGGAAQVALTDLTIAAMEPGEYRLQLVPAEGEVVSSRPLELKKPNWIIRGFRTIITRPLLNALVWVADALPNKSFGLSVVLVTLFVRFLLFVPNQKAFRSQRKMQRVQPEIKALQKKYADDKQKLAQETMALYKRYKVNPVSGCLPVLLQMPVLLGLYYTLQNGLSPHLQSLLYAPLSGISFANLNTEFLGLDMGLANIFPLPVLVAVAQWLAMRFSFTAASAQNDQMAQMQKIMQWGLPVMIGFFTATLPSAVGVYWFVSTLFGVGQQFLLRREEKARK